MVHYWSVTIPFTTVSVDIWSSGKITKCYGRKTLLNTMCDMCQKVVSVVVTGTEVLYVGQIFMEHVLLKSRLCLMVVITDGNEFRGIFEKMCNVSGIKFHIVAKHNHKVVGWNGFTSS